jgi:hypothetical protein
MHNTNERRIVVNLPVDGPFLSVPRVILGRFDTHRFLRFGYCLLSKLIHDVLAEIDHCSNCLDDCEKTIIQNLII